MKQLIELSDPEQPIAYLGEILANGSSSLQEWVIMRTKNDGDCLFINQQLQSSTLDEAIYHEMMVHTLLLGIKTPKKVLILGGSEGCMLREVLRWSSVESVHQVDWDESLCKWFQTEGESWNQGAYKDPRVECIYEDALTYLRFSEKHQYDAVFIDLLDPHTETDEEFMKNIMKTVQSVLKPGGGLCMNVGLVKEHQTTPACHLAEWMKQEFKEPAFHRTAFKIQIPSYLGEWGFLMATSTRWSIKINDTTPPDGLTHFNRQQFLKSTQWGPHYPSELHDFWKQETTWASIVAKSQSPMSQ